jgi:ribosomal protein L7/L12
MVTETDVQLLRSRINELEDRLKFLYQRLGIDYVTDPNTNPINSPQIQAALRSGNKIEAIKIYREVTGVGLSEAKDVIDKAERLMK